jgi:hypothetical protein
MQYSLFFGNNTFFNTFDSQLANSGIKENQQKQYETNLNYRRYMVENTNQINEINFLATQKNSAYQ